MSIWQKIKDKFNKEPRSTAEETEVAPETTSLVEEIKSQGNKIIDSVTNCAAEQLEALKASQEEGDKFKTYNIVAEKLNLLEQYIKIFSLNFPKEYAKYLDIIQSQRKEYDEELRKYQGSFEGSIAFAIDPEAESRRLVAVKNLEVEIKDFVDYVVNFSAYETKFSILSSKLNVFYNALLDTEKGTDAISAQMNNGINSMASLIGEVVDLNFFNKDLRKKEKILNHIIYGEYIFLKTSLRCCLAKDFDDFKYRLSQFHDLFITTDYDNLIFKFFIEDLEQYQLFITSELAQDPSFDYILNICENLQNRLGDYQSVFHNSEFFTTLIQFENTIDGISQGVGNKFTIPLPQMFKSIATNPVKSIEVKTIATSVLSIINLNKANLLCEVVRNFKTDISWREFYFLCKIFELHDEVIEASKDTVFDSVQTKFVALKTKYSEYSDSFIKSEKEKLLRYNGSKSKKYIFLLNLSQEDLPIATDELEKLCLDFCVCGTDIYLNHAYFSGFTNLEKNFGNYKLMEDLK